MNFEWDNTKAASNKAKHGVSFDLASLVFFDPLRIESHDCRKDYGEDRFVTIGIVAAKPLMLSVVYTPRNGEKIRLISARIANEKERRWYYQAHT